MHLGICHIFTQYVFNFANTLILLFISRTFWQPNTHQNRTTINNLLDEVRHRGGITGNMSSRTDLDSQEKMRNFIHKERTVELAFEEHRWWDVRRWGVAREALSRDIIGMDIAHNGRYSRKVAQQRVFEDKMYLYPIPEGEVWKTNIENNPGW